MEWFDKHGWIQGEIPADCVADCHHSGQCDTDVEHWRAKLDFTVPRQLAISFLREYGAWDTEELAGFSDTRLAETVLWLACGDIANQGDWFGLVH